MKLYNNTKNKLVELNEKTFKLEREIQDLFEANLEALMGLTLVKSEFTIKNKRIDTLAYDKQTNAFIIIEFKRDKNATVIEQGFAYLSLMLENKADFIVEYNEKLKQNLRREDVDWTQTRVAFVSTAFTENQIQSTNFKDIAIELWEVKQYENNMIAVTPIKKTNSAASIKPVMQQSQTLKKVIEEIKVYTEEEHMACATEEIAELYVKFRDAILNLTDGIEIKPIKFYIGFKLGVIFAYIQMQKKAIKIFIKEKYGVIDDAKQLGYSKENYYTIVVDSDKDLEYIMSLIKQVVVK